MKIQICVFMTVKIEPQEDGFSGIFLDIPDLKNIKVKKIKGNTSTVLDAEVVGFETGDVDVIE